MTLEDLRTFIAVVESGNLSAAARALGRTQPAVSQHVRRIEREVGIVLLERGTRKADPTQAGRILYAGGSKGLDSLAQALAEIRRLRAGSIGSLTISTGGTTVRHFMRDAVVRFSQLHERVSLQFEHGNSTQQCLQNVALGRADIAFVTIADQKDGFERRAVVQMPLVLLARRDDSLAVKHHLQIRDLKRIRHISLPHATTHSRLISDALAGHGVKLNQVALVDDFDTASVFVEKGLGHAIVPALHAQHFEERGSLKAVRVYGLPLITVGWAARQFQRLPRAALEFAKALAESSTRWADIPAVKILEESMLVA